MEILNVSNETIDEHFRDFPYSPLQKPLKMCLI
jgi:hypothetical protein